jgi:hypothetical protein
MRCKALHRRNGIPLKVLSRLLWHPAYQAGFPVRFRTASNIFHPTVRFNGHWLDIRLPIEQGRCIGLLARLVRQWRNGQRPNETPTPKAKSASKAPANGTPTNGTVATAKPTPTNGARPVATAKANGTGKKPKARLKPPKPIPLWQREWNMMWDVVMQALFAKGPAGDQ